MEKGTEPLQGTIQKRSVAKTGFYTTETRTAANTVPSFGRLRYGNVLSNPIMPFPISLISFGPTYSSFLVFWGGEGGTVLCVAVDLEPIVTASKAVSHAAARLTTVCGHHTDLRAKFDASGNMSARGPKKLIAKAPPRRELGCPVSLEPRATQLQIQVVDTHGGERSATSEFPFHRHFAMAASCRNYGAVRRTCVPA